VTAVMMTVTGDISDDDSDSSNNDGDWQQQ